MSSILEAREIRDQLERLARANTEFAAAYPGDPTDRQPVHTVYGGGHLFTHDVTRRLGAAARSALAEYAPDWIAFARALGLPGAGLLPALPGERAAFERLIDEAAADAPAPNGWLAREVHARVVSKLEHEPVEDFRADFEDGYGVRPDPEEDAHVVAAANEMALGMERGSLPPFVGIRIKPFTEELRARGLRTLDLFLGTLLPRTGGRLPAGFVVTLPKVTIPEQVETLVTVFEQFERAHDLPPRALRLEIMVETPTSVLAPDGTVPLRRFVAAAAGRCRGAHLGVYDYTASVQVTALHQHPAHPACAQARQLMQVALAGSGVTLSDGATTVMPVPIHRAAPGSALTPGQIEDNRRAVHDGWRLHFDDVRRALREAYYQGWDLHPAQLPSRHAAVIAYFLEGQRAAAERLRRFVDRAAQATLLGQVFDDAATGQGLLNHFLRGLSCGAFTEAEALATGLTLEELRGRSFTRILAGRRGA